MKKFTIIIVILIIVLLFVFIKKFPYDKQDNEPPELQKITIMMPFIPQVQWSAYYTAKHNEYYKDEGLDVEIQYTTKGNAGPIEQLVGGNVDFILTARDTIITARSKDLDIVAVYPIETTNLFYIVSEEDKNITKPSDLIGKKVGIISSASGAYANLLVILHLSNININDIEIVQAGTAVVPAFLEGEFEAVAIHLSQKLLIEEKIPNLNIINASDYTDMSTGHIAVNRDLAESDPELIKKFLRATKRGIVYATNNPSEAVEIYIGFYPEAEIKREVSQDLWNTFISEYNYDKSIPTLESSEDWQATQDFLYDIGIITKKTSVSEMYTNDFFEKIKLD